MQTQRYCKQHGLTLVSLLVILTLGLFATMIMIKMIPSYLENYAIRQVFQGLPGDNRLARMTPSEIKATVPKRLQINGVNSLKRDALVISSTKRGIKVAVDYEVRKPVVGNVSVVMEFAESVEFRP